MRWWSAAQRDDFKRTMQTAWRHDTSDAREQARRRIVREIAIYVTAPEDRQQMAQLTEAAWCLWLLDEVRRELGDYDEMPPGTFLRAVERR